MPKCDGEIEDDLAENTINFNEVNSVQLTDRHRTLKIKYNEVILTT